MDRSQILILAFGAAVLVAFMLSDIFRIAGVPNILVAALALLNAAMLGLGVLTAAVLAKAGPES